MMIVSISEKVSFVIGWYHRKLTKEMDLGRLDKSLIFSYNISKWVRKDFISFVTFWPTRLQVKIPSKDICKSFVYPFSGSVENQSWKRWETVPVSRKTFQRCVNINNPIKVKVIRDSWFM